MRRTVMACVAVLLVTGCSGPTSPPRAKASTVAPTLKAGASVIAMNAGVLLGYKVDCDEMPGDYQALRTDAQIVLRDSADKIVATARLEPIQNINDAGRLCSWTADFADIPAGGAFYTVSIGKWKSDSMAESDLATRQLSINTVD